MQGQEQKLDHDHVMSQVAALVVVVLSWLSGLVPGISLCCCGRACCWLAGNDMLGGPNWKPRTSCLLSGLLVLAGDIQPNPGPQANSTNCYLRVVCSTKVRNEVVVVTAVTDGVILAEQWGNFQTRQLHALIPGTVLLAVYQVLLPSLKHQLPLSLDGTASDAYQCSLLSKLNEISLLVSNHFLDVLINTFKTWLDEWVCDAELSLPGYNLLMRWDRNRHGGGVVIYSSASIKYIHHSDLQSDSTESL